jgi:hypothetical protein
MYQKRECRIVTGWIGTTLAGLLFAKTVFYNDAGSNPYCFTFKGKELVRFDQ